MTIAWDTIEGAHQLLFQAALRPVQGTRFQPTGFPDLGPATYELSQGGMVRNMLLVESAQSMANRLEAVCWDEGREDVVTALQGLPYVRVKLWDSGRSTSSLLEAHRLNSIYITSDASFLEELRRRAAVPERGKKPANESGSEEDTAGVGPIDLRAVARAVFHYDPCSILHGIFLEKLDGRVRLQRTLSGFIEAADVGIAPSGGVKNDRVAAAGFGAGFKAEQGYGNVPFHRTEFTANAITAYFSLDVAQIRAYGLGDAAERLLTVLALWKVARLLESGLRLRTACDLEVDGGLHVSRPAGFSMPAVADLERELPGLISECANLGLFAIPPVTELVFNKPKK